MRTRTSLLPSAPAPAAPPPPALRTPAHPLHSSPALQPQTHSRPLPAPCAARISSDAPTSSLRCSSEAQTFGHSRHCHHAAHLATAPLPHPSSSRRHASSRPAASLCVCAAAPRDEAGPSSSSSNSSSRSSSPAPSLGQGVSSSPSSMPRPTQPQQQQMRARSGSASPPRTQQRGPMSGFASSGSYDDELQLSPPYPASPHPSFASMDGPSNDELLRPSPSGRGGSGSTTSSASAGEDSLSTYLAATFSRTPRSSPSGRSNNRRPRMSMPQSYDSPGSGGLGPGTAPSSRDPFASFRAYQQAAPLQQGATLGLDGGERLQAFRRAVMPKLRSGWYASPGHTAESLSQEILTRCERKPIGIQPLFLLVRLCESQEDARTALATISAVRAAAARLQGNLVPFMSHAGHNLARAFTSMCCRCDASDVMASALIHASEVGLPITYKSVHLAMMHWAQLQELPKMEQVLDAMPQGGLPFIPKTAYIIIRGAVNAGRQELAEMYAARMMAAGVRLHPSVNMLLEVGRERARQRAQALQGNEEEW